jgi:hypothetical protein
MHRRRKVVGQKAPFKAKSSPAIILLTPEAPIRQTAPSTPAPKTGKTAEASAKDATPAATPARGSKRVTFGGKTVDIEVEAGNAAKWKKKADALFHLDGLQEETSNNLTSAMSSFVQRTSIVKEVCIPCSPRALWQLLVDNPSWFSKRNYFGIFSM